jgi:transmembrane sensor
MGVNPQDEQAYRVAYLIAGYLKETLSPAENQELDDWVCANMDNQRLFEELTDPKTLETWAKWKEKLPAAEVLERLKTKMEFTPPKKLGVIRSLWPYAAAACVLLTIGILFEWLHQNPRKIKGELATNQVQDIAPGSSRAVLTLANGSSILLESVKQDSLISQGAVNIIKKDSGLLSYSKNNAALEAGKVEYNTLTVPPAGQYSVLLPDGSHVWLNASSSLKYPTTFKESVRKVELTGEGYFEVAKDPAHPFIVAVGKNEVQVIGTHFDINAYLDNPGTTVSLAEGSVKLNGSVLLKPGEQGVIQSSGGIQTGPADLETALAWKNGQFIFKMTALPQVMLQVSHWYNARIIFDDSITEHFNARIPRDVPVSQLLFLLEATGRVHFKIEDNTIRVMK